MLKCSCYNKNEKQEKLALLQNVHRYTNAQHAYYHDKKVLSSTE